MREENYQSLRLYCCSRLSCRSRAFLAPPWKFSAELGGRYESNASNSNLASDRLADGFFTAHLNAGTSGVWGRDWRWHAYLAGEGEQAFRFTGLSQIEGGVRLGVDRKKFGLGWNAPRLQIDFYTAYRGSGQDGASGARLSPSFGFVWQFVERGGVSIRYLPQWFFAEGAVFYSGSQEGRIAGWFDLFPKTRLVRWITRFAMEMSFLMPRRHGPTSPRSQRSKSRPTSSVPSAWSIALMPGRIAFVQASSKI